MATIAASVGWEVAIFFTFYGLDIVHKDRMPKLSASSVGNPAMPPPMKSRSTSRPWSARCRG